ncbi:hypothetical protein ABK040_000505 [Willaertia magna]
MSSSDPYVIDDDEDCGATNKNRQLAEEDNDEDDEDEIDIHDTKPALESVFCETMYLGGGNFTFGGKLNGHFGLPGLELIPKPSSITSNQQQDEGIQSMPSLTTCEYKPIALPILCKEQANELISHCSKAPYGRGEQTIYDDNVRNTWQLSPSQFRISNKKWDQMIDNLINDELKPGLGINEHVEVKCSLYKLLLYEEGGHFEFHRDTEKEDKMFATLVIQLPSVYKGGNIIVKHGSSEQIYDLSEESAYTPCFFSFYCDCKHKVDVVTSGYRLCLIYNVCYISGSKPRAIDYTVQLSTLERIVNHWDETQPFVCYLLKHKYSKAGLSFHCLKGRDSKLRHLIRQYNAKHENNDQVEALLGIMTKTDNGIGEPHHIEWEDTLYNVSDIVGESEETGVPSGFELHESDIIPTETLEDLKIAGEEIEEDTGNEGATASRWYKSACIVIYPKRFKYMLALRFGDSFAIAALNNLWESYLCDNSTKNQFVKYLKSFIEKDFRYSVANYVAELKELSLAQLLLSGRSMDIKDVKILTSSFGINTLRSLLEKTLKHFHFNKVADFLEMFPDNSLAQKVVPCLLTVDNKYLRFGSWDVSYEKALTTCQKFNITLSDDTKKRILSTRSSDKINQLYELGCKLKDVFCLLEVLKRSLTHNSYNRYDRQNQNNTLNIEIIVNCVHIIGLNSCKTVVGNLISNYVGSIGILKSLDCIELFNDYTKNTHITDLIVKYIIKSIMNAKNIENQSTDCLEKILVVFYKCGAITEMNVLLEMIIPHKNRFTKYNSVIYPLIMKLSRAGSGILNSEPIQMVIRKCLTFYDSFINTLSKIPAPNNWAIDATINCLCDDCRKCNTFLKSPTETTFNLKASQQKRTHLEVNAQSVTIDLQFKTVKQGSPHTLVLTKIRKRYELNQKYIEEARTNRNHIYLFATSEPNPPTKKVKSK